MIRLTRPHSETEAELLKDSEYVKALSLELDETVKELERLRTEIAELKAERDRLASAIHYPEHWDTTAYPTLYDALNEIGCNQCEEA